MGAQKTAIGVPFIAKKKACVANDQIRAVHEMYVRLSSALLGTCLDVLVRV